MTRWSFPVLLTNTLILLQYSHTMGAYLRSPPASLAPRSRATSLVAIQISYIEYSATPLFFVQTRLVPIQRSNRGSLPALGSSTVTSRQLARALRVNAEPAPPVINSRALLKGGKTVTMRWFRRVWRDMRHVGRHEPRSAWHLWNYVSIYSVGFDSV